MILHKALADAAKRGIVVRNAAAEAEPPKRRRPRGEIRAWSATQLHSFLNAALPERLFPAFWLAANTGMRRSELLGLHWSDIDLDTAHLSVNRALVSVSYELHESRGKTRNSSRWIDLDATTVEVLERWRERVEADLGRTVTDDDYVFCSPPARRHTLTASRRSSTRSCLAPGSRAGDSTISAIRTRHCS